MGKYRKVILTHHPISVFFRNQYLIFFLTIPGYWLKPPLPRYSWRWRLSGDSSGNQIKIQSTSTSLLGISWKIYFAAIARGKSKIPGIFWFVGHNAFCSNFTPGEFNFELTSSMASVVSININMKTAFDALLTTNFKIEPIGFCVMWLIPKWYFILVCLGVENWWPLCNVILHAYSFNENSKR